MTAVGHSERSRRIPLRNLKQFDGILRLRFTALRMTSWIALASAQVTPRGELKILRA